MAWEYNTILAATNALYGYARQHVLDFVVDNQAAMTHWQAGQDHECLYDLMAACVHLQQSCHYLTTRRTDYGHSFSEYGTILLVHLLQDNDYAPDLIVRWYQICSAWTKDDFEGMEWTIACIDRMRQLMWDEPFNIKWAASPTEKRE